MMKKLFLLAFLLHSSIFFGQNNLLVFSDSIHKNTNTVYLNFDDLSFIKNNEYFNLIADGYTLFGNKLDVDLSIKPHQNYQVKVGFMALKYYGLDAFSKIIPSFSLQINQGNNTYIFGKLQNNDKHLLSDQIYGFERLLDKRSIENGVEHRYKNKHWQTDTWLEWEHFIKKNDSDRERLNFGQTTTYHTTIAKNWEITLPLQLYLHHRGGQINQRNTQTEHLNNAMVVANISGGLQLSKKVSNRAEWGAEYQYFIHSINSDNVEELHFKNGSAHLISAFFKTAKWQGNLSYWKADKFVAPKADDMYQSISKRVEKYTDSQANPETVFATYTEPNRELLHGFVSYKNKLFKDLYIGAQLDAYLQLNEGTIQSNRYNVSVNNQFDYAIGLYILYRFNTAIFNAEKEK